MTHNHDLSFDEFDELVNPRLLEPEFDHVVESTLSRRGFLGGVLALGGVTALASGTLLAPARAQGSRFTFEAIPANTSDAVTVPAGFKTEIVARRGDPIFPDTPEFDPATRGTAESQARAFGDDTDGMEVFSHVGRTLLAVNNEYTNRAIIWGNRGEAGPDDDDILKGMMAHGVTVVEMADGDNGWQIVKDSPYNRRITPQTEIEITIPAAGHALMQTAADPAGTKALGTWNNCGNGTTPWGTYLACEENFNGYFSAEDENHKVSDELKRYGVSSKDWGYSWAKVDARFDVSKHPNEPNRVGYVVEINPTDSTSTPNKRTALGRFKHENAECVVNNDGKLVIYMGEDERGEFLYRYVSDNAYAPGADTDELMENDTLYAAKFHDTGAGEWLELSEATTGMSKAEICIHTRQAASKVGATTMDRPEWVAANPNAPELYCALTNNTNRGLKPNGGDHTSAGFAWDLYVMAGNPEVREDARKGSGNLNAGNMFNSPDGLSFDEAGLLWIQTDGNSSNEADFAEQGNNQMLAAGPATGEIRRFLVGPKECEVTGACLPADRRTMFAGIQHPGEKGGSQWPDGNDVPRSAIIAVRREDGGPIG